MSSSSDANNKPKPKPEPKPNRGPQDWAPLAFAQHKERPATKSPTAPKAAPTAAPTAAPKPPLHGDAMGAFRAWQPGQFASVSGVDANGDAPFSLGLDSGHHIAPRGADRRQEPRDLGDRRATEFSAHQNEPLLAPGTVLGNAVADWQARITTARQSGYADGYRDGLVALEGFKQSHALHVSTQMAQLLQSFEDQLQALEADMAQAVARSAVKLAQQVLRCELQAQPQAVAEVARQAVQALMHSARHITVHVNPQDLPLVATGAQEVLGARGAKLRADTAVQRGGVRVHSDLGHVDATLELRWQQACAGMGVELAADGAAAAVSAAAP